MNSILAVDFTRIGLICDFLAFFLAAPEILGEERILKFQGYLKTFLIISSFVLLIISAIGTAALLLFWVVIPLATIASAAIAFNTGGWEMFTPDNLILLYLVLGIGSAALSRLPRFLMRYVERLGASQPFRRQLLNMGILLFVVGAIAQILGTF